MSRLIDKDNVLKVEVQIITDNGVTKLKEIGPFPKDDKKLNKLDIDDELCTIIHNYDEIRNSRPSKIYVDLKEDCIKKTNVYDIQRVEELDEGELLTSSRY